MTNYIPGQRVHHRTSGRDATVIRVDADEIIIKVDGDPLTLNTRAVFLEVK